MGIFASTKSEVRIAKKVLKEKYNEDFEIISLGGRGGTLTNDTFTIKCYPERHPHQAVRGAGKRRHRGCLPRRLPPLHGAYGADAQREQRWTGSRRHGKIRGIWLTV